MRTLSYVQLNRLVRGAIIAVLIGSIVFITLAARPAPQPFGGYDAETGLDNPLYGQGGAIVAVVTVTDAAVVTFPPDWKQPDVMCIALTYQRGDGPLLLDNLQYLPQVRWDEQPGETAIVYPLGSIAANSPDGGRYVMRNNDIAGWVTTRLGYRVRWLPDVPIPLYRDQPIMAVDCLGFDVNGAVYIPAEFVIAFKIRNTLLDRYPQLWFRFQEDTPPSRTLTTTLYRVPIADYLAKLAAERPELVTKPD